MTNQKSMQDRYNVEKMSFLIQNSTLYNAL